MRSGGVLVLLLLGLACSAVSATANGSASFNGTIAYEVYSNKTAWLEAMDLTTDKVRRLTKPVAGVAGYYGGDYGPYAWLTWSPDGDVLAFARTARDGRDNVYSLEVSTGKLRNLTAAAPARPRGGYDGYGKLAWSPDGESLAFTRYTRGSGSGIYVVDREGTGLRRLATLSSKDQIVFSSGVTPIWSSDGTDLAYIRSRYDEDSCAEDVRIHVVDVESGKTVVIPTKPALAPKADYGYYVEILAWQPGGDQLLYAADTESYSESDESCSSDNGATAIYSVTPPATRSTQLLSDGGNLSDALWSPNGETIAYANWTNENLYVMNASGKNKRVLLDDGDYGRYWDLAWTPDSKGILEGAAAGVGIKNVATRRYHVLARWKQIEREREGSPIDAVGTSTVAVGAGVRDNGNYHALSERVVIAALAGRASKMVTLKPSASKLYLGETAVALP